MKIGYLNYNIENNRFGIVNNKGEWLDNGLYCGEMFEILINHEWMVDRIEYTDVWYLVYSKLKDSQLQNQKVRYK